MGWQTVLLELADELPWKSTTYYAFHQYIVTEMSDECDEAFDIFRKAIAEHGEKRPFYPKLKSGEKVVWYYLYLDVGEWTYWTGKDWTRPGWQRKPGESYGINRKPREYLG